MTRDRLWTWLAVILPAFAATIAPVATGDLAYQVRTGELMLASGHLVTTDPFTFTAAGTPWLNQQWATGIVMAAVHDLAGWGGLALLRTVLIAAVMGSVFVACRQSSPGRQEAPLGPRAASLLALAGFLVGIGSLALRAQLLGIACFAAVLLIVARRGSHPRGIWLAPVVVVAWANVHGSFFLGPAMLAVAAVDDLLARRATWRAAAVAAVVAGLATGLTPFGFDVWRYSLGLSTNPVIANMVTEWQRTAPLSGLGVVFYGSVIAVVAALVAASRRGWRPPIGTLAWLAGLAALGAYAERGVVWWALGAPAAVAPAVAVLVAGRTRGRVGRPEPPTLLRLNAIVAAGAVVATVLLQPLLRPAGDALSGPVGTLRDAPAGLARALAGLAGPGDRAVISQAWASWFEWAAPGVPVMVDSRIEVIPTDAWGEYLTIVHGGPDALAALDRARASVVVVDPVEIPAIGVTLSGSGSGWRRAFADVDGSIFVREP